MDLDEVAKKLGYIDTEHLESNIENYGEPLPKWWQVIKELVNELPLDNIVKRFTYKQPVLWKNQNKFYVTEDHGLDYVKVTNTKDGIPDFTIEYKVLRSSLTAL